MNPIFANYTVSLHDLELSRNEVLQKIQFGPVAVMSHDKALFYVVGPQMLQSLYGRSRSENEQIGSDSSGAVVKSKGMDGGALVLGPTFSEMAEKLLALESQRVLRGEFSAGSVGIIKNRLKANILPVLGHIPISQVGIDELQALLVRLSEQESSTTTISQYMVIVRKVLKLALARKLIREVPEIPKVRITSKPRSTFTATQYLQLLRVAKRLARQGGEVPCIKQGDGLRERFWVTQKYRVMSADMYWLIGFMTNSFVRPSDIRTIKHKHVELVRGDRVYLKLNLPTTKKHDKPVVTLRPAVRIYEQLLQAARLAGHADPEDYVFLPGERDRTHALAIFNFWFKHVLREAGISLSDNHDQARTLYCLRHTAITFRLLYGQGIDMLTLARNARTSVDMIENFYASTLAGEMNVGMLQSRRGTSGR